MVFWKIVIKDLVWRVKIFILVCDVEFVVDCRFCSKFLVIMYIKFMVVEICSIFYGK